MLNFPKFEELGIKGLLITKLSILIGAHFENYYISWRYKKIIIVLCLERISHIIIMMLFEAFIFMY